MGPDLKTLCSPHPYFSLPAGLQAKVVTIIGAPGRGPLISPHQYGGNSAFRVMGGSMLDRCAIDLSMCERKDEMCILFHTGKPTYNYVL